MKKPVNSRVLSQPDRLWKLNLLADVTATMSEYDKSETQIEEEDTRISVIVPRKKGSHRSSSMATQWTTRVIQKQRVEEEEEERSLTKRKTVGRFEVGPSSRPTELEPERLLLLPSTVVTECKKHCPINISKEERRFKKRKTIRRLEQDTAKIPEWLEDLMMREEINGHDPKLIVAKELYKSDLDRNQARLSMPLNQVVSSDFLNEEETRIIYEQSVLTE